MLLYIHTVFNVFWYSCQFTIYEFSVYTLWRWIVTLNWPQHKRRIIFQFIRHQIWHSINRNNIDWLWWRTWIYLIGLKINKNSNCQEANTILLCSPATKKTTTNYKEESLLCILSWFIKMKRVYSWASLQYSGCWLQLFNCVMCEGLPHRIVGDGKITISQSQSQFLPAQKSLKNIV